MPGRAFYVCLYAMTSRVTAPHNFICITKELKEDLEMWRLFLTHFNGVFFQHPCAYRQNYRCIHVLWGEGGEAGLGVYWQMCIVHCAVA